MRKRLIAALLIMLLCMGMSMTAYAVPQITPEEQPPAEATEEEAQAFKAAQLKKYYDMPVATNEIKGWPQGPGTYGEAAIIMEAGTGSGGRFPGGCGKGNQRGKRGEDFTGSLLFFLLPG